MNKRSFVTRVTLSHLLHIVFSLFNRLHESIHTSITIFEMLSKSPYRHDSRSRLSPSLFQRYSPKVAFLIIKSYLRYPHLQNYKKNKRRC